MIGVVNTGTGNVGSVQNMLHVLGYSAVLSASADDLEKCDRLVLPGVGAFDEGMKQLRARDLVAHLNRLVIERGVPVLGLCLGMQMLSKGSEEGDLAGLGWIPAVTRRIRRPEGVKIPHMGWNWVHPRDGSQLFSGLDDAKFYFAHSYELECTDPGMIEATADYAGSIVAAVRDHNILGVQFHPEKSHRFGMRLLRNFAEGTFS